MVAVHLGRSIDARNDDMDKARLIPAETLAFDAQLPHFTNMRVPLAAPISN